MASLDGVEAFLFDIFGTVVDWRGSVTAELQRVGTGLGLPQSYDYAAFAQEWRKEYFNATFRVSQGGTGPKSVDVLHRQILEDMLRSSKWEKLGSVLDSASRDELNMIWHHLYGWPDSSKGLYDLKKHAIIAALSNGNLRLLIDMAKYADLPWDTVFSAELFNTFKPAPEVYKGALYHLSLQDHPEKCVLVAAHLFDLKGAKKVGIKTVYIPRAGEDSEESIAQAKLDEDVDIVVGSFAELVKLVEKK